MPMPTPHAKEDKQTFVSRFMGDAAMVKEYPDENQRVAVAYKAFGEKQNVLTDHAAQRSEGAKRYGK
jgi:hypothetical protein